MRHLSLLSAVLVIAVAVLTACNSNEMIGQHSSNPELQKPQQAQPAPSDGARRITAQELHDLWEQGQVFIIDTRGDAAYQTGHIKGAVVIVPNDIIAKADTLPRNKMIVTYCT